MAGVIGAKFWGMFVNGDPLVLADFADPMPAQNSTPRDHTFL
jgi:hypothetical protein